MPRPGHGAGQRGGHRRRAQRAGQLPRVPPQPEAVDDADHRLRRPAGRRPGPAGLAGFGQGHAAQLDRPLGGRAGPVPGRRRRRAIEVFTTRPDTLFGATYMVLAPEHPLVDAIATPRVAGRTSTSAGRAARRDPADGGRGATAPRRPASPSWTARRTRTRPASSPAPSRSTRSTASAIPVFVADYVLMGYGTGAIMAVPGQDQRDWDFATRSACRSSAPCEPPDGLRGRGVHRRRPGDQLGQRRDQPERAGRRRGQARRSSTGWSRSGAGEARIQYKLRDWLFSRQRYWGEPFPIVWDADGRRSRCRTTSCRSSCPRSTTTRPSTYDPDDADTEPEPPLSRATEWLVDGGRAG